MAELPQSFLPSTKSGAVAVPTFDEPESSRDRSSALAGEPLHVRRDIRSRRRSPIANDGRTEGEEPTNPCSSDLECPRDRSSVGRLCNSDYCRPTNPFQPAPEQLAEHLCSPSIFVRASHETPEAFHCSIEQLAEVFSAIIYEEALIDPQPRGSDDPHKELVQQAIDRFSSYQKMVPSQCKPPPRFRSPYASSKSSGDGDLKISEDFILPEQGNTVSVARRLQPSFEDSTALDVVVEERAHGETSSRGQVRRRLFCSGVGEQAVTSGRVGIPIA
ncbi:hypothetical protein HPB50_014183 [Hyalomma asiaticum]|uniref:Uncharacterized protein n=1 Tax=Hyalomma asiaticum TaxID=266040 RepID=A0ACB7SLT0_HYAAI|nr:hypothetical protein HPB50_014183 [Hyalomma asiaticum]